MARFNWKGVHFILFTLVIFHAILALSEVPAVCSHVDCGQGTCFPSNASLLGVDCQCNPGWTKIPLGPVGFSACVVPNCTFDLQCGNNGSPPAPAQPIPPFNISNPCSLLVWCGEGTCEADGIGHICKCNEGAANLLNMTAAPCFKKCSFGSDCTGVGLYPSAPQPPPPEKQSSSTKPGSSDQVLNGMNLHLISMALLIGAFFI